MRPKTSQTRTNKMKPSLNTKKSTEKPVKVVTRNKSLTSKYQTNPQKYNKLVYSPKAKDTIK